MTRATFSTEFAIAALAAFLLILPATSMSVAAADGVLTDSDKTCLACHGNEEFKKDLADGKTLSLHVAGEAFARSVHAALGCAGCHSDISVEKHAAASRVIKDPREYSIAMAAACRQCHEDISRQHEGSNHANLLRQGNLRAPVCTDCHGSHSVTPRAAFDTCVGCHSSAMDGHQKWLPNARLHLEVVSCAACHAPAVQRMVDLRLYDNTARGWVTEKEPRFEKLARAADADGNGLDPAELRKLLAEINRDETPGQKTLRGRIELRNPAEAHQLAAKSEALRVCDNCHRDGAEPFQKVTVSIVSADGKPLHHNAHKDVLISALSMDSVRSFYAIGGTRNKVLDILAVLALLGGISVPVGHQMLKRMVLKQSEDEKAKGASGNSPASDQPDDGNAPR